MQPKIAQDIPKYFNKIAADLDKVLMLNYGRVRGEQIAVIAPRGYPITY